MSNMVWITHPDTGASVEVLRDALPLYRQAGWDLLPDKDVKQAAQLALEEAAAADKAMTEAGLAAIPSDLRPEDTAEAAPAEDTTDADQAEGSAE